MPKFQPGDMVRPNSRNNDIPCEIRGHYPSGFYSLLLPHSNNVMRINEIAAEAFWHRIPTPEEVQAYADGRQQGIDQHDPDETDFRPITREEEAWRLGYLDGVAEHRARQAPHLDSMSDAASYAVFMHERALRAHNKARAILLPFDDESL